LRQVDRPREYLDSMLRSQISGQLIEKRQPARDQDAIDTRRCELARKFRSNSIGCTRNQGPRPIARLQ
jgi:hypothetical protein